MLSRGDSVTSTHSAGPRLLTKQDSSTSTISWRLSPSSSGYKSQSQRSDSVTPSPTATPLQLSDMSGKNSLEEPIQSISEETDLIRRGLEEKIGKDNKILWAVTDMQSVPKGSILINPETGQPFTNQDGSIYHFDPSNPPPGFTPPTPKSPQSPVKLISPRKSPIKEYSPKKSKSKTTISRNKGLINSSTSPSLPLTPTIQNQPIPNMYVPNLENATNMPLQPYPVYPNGYTGIPPNPESNIPVYQPPVGMMYAPYGVPQYESRPDPNISDLPGYFVNMAMSDPNSQPVSYPPPNTYYQQPITYYPSQNTPQQQRYPVQLPVAGQIQGSYVPTTYPPNYVPVPPTQPAAPATDLLPVYNPQIPVIYQQQNPNIFMQNPNNMMYQQSPMYNPQGYTYSPNTTPNSNSNNSFTQTTPNQCFNQMHFENNRATPKNKFTKIQNYQPSSNHSSGGSNSPANTVISGYYPNTQMNYRQTPPETPPTQNIAYSYPPNYVPQSMIFRPVSIIFYFMYSQNKY